MGRPIGDTSERISFSIIKNLTVAEARILKTLINWKHQEAKSSLINISMETGISETHVYKCLRMLRARGIVGRSTGKAHFIYPNIKAKILEDLKGKEENEEKRQTL